MSNSTHCPSTQYHHQELSQQDRQRQHMGPDTHNWNTRPSLHPHPNSTSNRTHCPQTKYRHQDLSQQENQQQPVGQDSQLTPGGRTYRTFPEKFNWPKPNGENAPAPGQRIALPAEPSAPNNYMLYQSLPQDDLLAPVSDPKLASCQASNFCGGQ